MCAAPLGCTMASATAPNPEDSVVLIQVKLPAGVFTAPQRQEIIERLTGAMVAIECENMRQAVWCVIEEVADGGWGIGGQALTADDVKALARATPIGRTFGNAPTSL
jgi:4-oxalocrotonate tautomerase